MKSKKLALKIPVIYIFLLIVFMLVVNLIIGYNTQGYSKAYGIIYSLGFFIANPISSFILAFLLIIPLPLLAISIIRKKRDLIIGFSISVAISAILLILIGAL
ncbi:MAG: hypothetical protein GX857_10185 [Bacteroidales bacterium]|nr:hypothetical protein [Bacteroidales bacterium]